MMMKNSDEENEENDKLIDKHNKSKNHKKTRKKGTRVLYAFERKKFGGVRMCQRCLRTKVIILFDLFLA
jgi:hypothetical protein